MKIIQIQLSHYSALNISIPFIINNCMNRQQARGTMRKEREVSTLEKYQQASHKYLNGQFTYDTHCLIQNLTDKGMKEGNMQGVNLYKALIEISKILMMNELQILFLGATLQEMKWMFIDNCLNEYINDFKGFQEPASTDTHNKKAQLSLLLIGYIVKVYLNDPDQTTMLEYRIREFMEVNYDKMYQQWVERMKKNFKFSPKIVNKLFVQLEQSKTKNVGEIQINNYNSKVEDLFRLFMDPQVKNQYNKEPQIQEEQHDEDIQPLGYIGRTQSIQSLRSLGHRDSQRSQKQFGGPALKNLLSISMLRQSSYDSQI